MEKCENPFSPRARDLDSPVEVGNFAGGKLQGERGKKDEEGEREREKGGKESGERRERGLWDRVARASTT